MLLNQLTITRNDVILRDIIFKKGINLIVDSSIEISDGTGNNVGKTTALRAIDFCLGAKVGIFTQDKEFKFDNEKVKSYFENNNVLFTLKLTTKNNKEIILQRNASEKSATFLINEKKIPSLNSYTRALKSLFFLSDEDKPSIRQILTRFIRIDNEKMTNALKTLHGATSQSEYECLNLFLFNYGNPSLIAEKQRLLKLVKKLQEEYKFISQIAEIGALRQALTIINNDIKEKETEKENFNLSAAYEDETQKLESLKREISNILIDISNVETQKMLTEKSIFMLNENAEKIDPRELEIIYNEAKARLGNLPKTFEESLNFHKQMISRKLAFMRKDIPNMIEKISILKQSLNENLEKERKILKEISNTGSLSDLNLLQLSLNDLYEKRGKTTQAIENFEDIEKEKHKEEKNLKNVSDQLDQYDTEFQKKLENFNHYFSSFTKNILDEEYILYTSKDKESVNFKITPIDHSHDSANPGEGVKKSLVTAFDFAYLEYMNYNKSKSINFVAHDSIDAIHQNQVAKIFDIAEKMDGQYIVSTLRKTVEFMGEEFINSNTVLELSGESKFFRLEESYEQIVNKEKIVNNSNAG